MDRQYMSIANREDVPYDDDSQTASSSHLSWISWFCSLEGHEYYAEVPEDFIDDDFNLTGLSSLVPHYQDAIDTILDVDLEELSDHESHADQHVGSQDGEKWGEQPVRRRQIDYDEVEPYAMMLYGLIHQRYLLSRNGLRLMAERFVQEHFGYCPRVYCQQSPVIPCGRTDEPGVECVRLFCPRCMDLYNPTSPIFKNVDGAHFGTTYAHLMFQAYPELVPPPSNEIYQPRIFGFRVNEASVAGPRMQWLRMRPTGITEKDDPCEQEKSANQDLADVASGECNRVGKSAHEKQGNDGLDWLINRMEEWRAKGLNLNGLLKQLL